MNGSESWGWSDWHDLTLSFWNEAWEPVAPDDRITRIHRIDSVRSDFPLLARRTTLPSLFVEAQFRTTVEARLVVLQDRYYELVAKETETASSIQTAVDQLAGRKQVLHAPVRVGFPESYASDDRLRSFFTGDQGLLDREIMVLLCREAAARGRGRWNPVEQRTSWKRP